MSTEETAKTVYTTPVGRASWLKALVVLIASIGAEKAVFDIMQAACPKANKLPGRILRGIGIGVIISMVSDKVDTYVGAKANQLEEALNAIKTSLNNCTPARIDAMEAEDDNNDRTTEN